MVQLSYAELTRLVSRRRLLGHRRDPVRWRVRGAWRSRRASLTFAIPNVVSRIGGSPQHPVGNGLLAEQFPPERRGFAISAHIAGGNVGTVVVAVIGVAADRAVGWRGVVDRVRDPGDRSSRSRSCVFVRERGTDRAAAVAGGQRPRRASGGSCADRDLRWLYLTSVLGGGGRGLGVVNLFALLYLTRVHRPRRGDGRADVRRADRVLACRCRWSPAGCPIGSGASR